MSEKTVKMEKTQDTEWREIELRLLEESIIDIKDFFASTYVLLCGVSFVTILMVYIARFLGSQHLFQLSLDGLALVLLAVGLVMLTESVLLSFYYIRKIMVRRKLDREDLVSLIYHVFVASYVIVSLGFFVYYVFSRSAVSVTVLTG